MFIYSLLKGRNVCLVIILPAFLLLAGCAKNEPAPAPPVPPTPQELTLTSFIFKTTDNQGLLNDVTGIISNDSVSCFFPAGTVLTALKPTMEFKGKTISPANNITEDFSGPVSYTISSDDGKTKKYFVFAKTLPADAKKIVSFIFKTTDNPELTKDIPGNVKADSILLQVPFRTNLTHLIPTITFIGKKVIPASQAAVDFSSLVNYAVIADDGSITNYKVVTSFAVDSSDYGVDGTVYINATYNNDFGAGTPGGKVVAFDANSGKIKWTYQYPLNTWASSCIAFHDGVLYTGLGNDLVAIDTAVKTPGWAFTTGGGLSAPLSLAAPVYDNGIIYTASSDSNMYALNALDGSLKWKYFIGSPAISNPTSANGVIYTTAGNGYIYAIDAANGTEKWKTNDGNCTALSTAPSVVDDVLYYQNSCGDLVALDASDGSLKWKVQSYHGTGGSPTVAEGVVYFSNGFALDAQTGSIKWTFSPATGNGTNAIVDSGTVYYDGGANLYAVNAADGSMKWNYYHDEHLNGYSSVVVANGTVYVGGYQHVMAVNCKTGKLKWEYTSVNDPYFERFDSSPTVVDKFGNIFYPAVSGNKN